MNKKLLYSLAIICMLPPLAMSLDRLPVMLWDESRLAINAYEMSQSHQWLMPTFDGEPDMWNTKPPLLIWLQALMMNILGIDVIALRLPSVLAAVGTGCLILYFIGQRMGYYLWAALSCLVLVTINGYVDHHVTRTGDYDALLVFFMVAYSWAYFYYLHSQRQAYLLLFFILLSLAVLTKSIAGLMFLPGLMIYTFTQHQLFSIIKNKYLYLGIILFCIPIISYYGIRELYNPGYIAQVGENEIWGRYLQTLEQHHHPFYYYLKHIWTTKFTYWIPLALLGFIIGWRHKDSLVRKVSTLSSIIVMTFLTIISLSQTKLYWYDAPIYPFLAVMTALSIWMLYDYIKTFLQKKITSGQSIAALCIVSIVALPYYNIIHKVTTEDVSFNDHKTYDMSNFIRSEIAQPHSILDQAILVSDEYIPHTMWYLLQARDKNIHIKRHSSQEIQVGDKILFTRTELLHRLEQTYQMKEIKSHGEAAYYEIIDLLPEHQKL